MAAKAPVPTPEDQRRAAFLMPRIQEASNVLTRARQEVATEVLGQHDNIELITAGLLADGHILVEGDPGVGKTMTAMRLATVFNIGTKRVQCTPEIMPSDILGSEMIKMGDNGQGVLEFIRGPIFTNLLIPDEINRMSPRVQSALLQAMQEKKVTVAGVNYKLSLPFNVVATQNPHDSEGTYRLPQAQLDRFMMKLKFEHPEGDIALAIAKRATDSKVDIEDIMRLYEEGKIDEMNDLIRSGEETKIKSVLRPGQLTSMQQLARQIPVSDSVMGAIMTVAKRSRPDDSAPQEIEKNVVWGVGSRAEQNMRSLVRAFALMRGESRADRVADVERLVQPVFEHRMGLKYGAENKFPLIRDTLIHDL